jgi:hypothetical protein
VLAAILIHHTTIRHRVMGLAAAFGGERSAVERMVDRLKQDGLAAIAGGGNGAVPSG